LIVPATGVSVHRVFLPLQVGDQLLHPTLGERIEPPPQKLAIAQGHLLKFVAPLADELAALVKAGAGGLSVTDSCRGRGGDGATLSAICGSIH
jgi:hypothetical protein